MFPLPKPAEPEVAFTYPDWLPIQTLFDPTVPVPEYGTTCKPAQYPTKVFASPAVMLVNPEVVEIPPALTPTATDETGAGILPIHFPQRL
mgnify:CR=1 FL=1